MFSEWTTLNAGEVCRRLGTLPEAGLTEKEAEKRRRRWGENILAAASRISLPLLFLNQFKDFMVLILLGPPCWQRCWGKYRMPSPSL